METAEGRHTNVEHAGEAAADSLLTHTTTPRFFPESRRLSLHYYVVLLHGKSLLPLSERATFVEFLMYMDMHGMAWQAVAVLNVGVESGDCRLHTADRRP
jgi:hypothetical protein